jgi:hypothetical protein
MWTEEQVMKVVRDHVERQFPRTCTTCGHVYESLPDFVHAGIPLGEPASFDASQGNWEPEDDGGILSMINCPCGNTLGFSSQGMGLMNMWNLLRWLRKQSRQRGLPVSKVLLEIRLKIKDDILAEQQAKVQEA